MSSDDLLGLTPKFWSMAKKLGLKDPAQLLWLAPARYRDYREPLNSLTGLNVGDKFYGKFVVSRSPRMGEGRRAPLMLQVSDGERGYDVMIFGDNSQFRQLSTGSVVHLSGQLSVWSDRLQIKSPEIIGRHLQGRLAPEYLPGASGINRLTLASRIATLLETHTDTASAYLREALGESDRDVCHKLGVGFTDFKQLLSALHRPLTIEAGERAQEALGLLSAYAYISSAARATRRESDPLIPIACDPQEIDAASAALPFSLTHDQSAAIREIVSDIGRPVPMHRMLSGDVGSGKTISYLLPAVLAQRKSRQVVILMPNTLLASQTIGELNQLFPDVPSALLIEGSRPPQSLADKPIIIGTTSILHWKETLNPPLQIDFAIIDEQQKMGMGQKRDLCGPRTHFLEATATPMPRSLALAGFGVSSVSRIQQMPVSKEIETHLVGTESRARVFSHIHEAVKRGAQVAILYPQRDAGAKADAREARRAVEQAKDMWEKHFPGLVGALHGGMKNEDKVATLERMREGELRVVIATSVIEIGITLPDLKSLVVLSAELYGATTLHQFRGRVARKGGRGTFIMVSSSHVNALKDEARERLESLVRSNDGMEIAMADLARRGFGDLSKDAIRQSGFEEGVIPGLKITPAMADTVIARLDRHATQQGARQKARDAETQNIRAGASRRMFEIAAPY